MAINSFDLGDLIELKITFRNDAGAVTDPTSPTLAVHKPDGTTTTYVHPTDAALVKDSTGVYHVNYTPTMAGTNSGHHDSTCGRRMRTGRMYSTTGPNQATGKHSRVPVRAASGAL